MSSYGSRSYNENPFESRPSIVQHPSNDGYASDDPYKQYSTPIRAALGNIDPNAIDDDGDDGLAPANRENRKTGLFGRKSVAGVAGAAGAGAAAGAFLGHRDGSANYGPLPGNNRGAEYGPGGEKSEWLSREKSGNKKLKIIVGTIIIILAVGAIAGAIVGGIIGSRNSNSGDSQPQTAAEDDGKGDLSKDSPEIQKLLNNPDLHRVFPGMDYTPLNAQYPDCLTNPPSQNNITRDMAILSQLTPAIRLYGTDCNQTEMVLHSIDRLGLTDQKVWMGAWLGNNDTTNKRQLSQMWDVLDKHGGDSFAGLIVGNEVLFRKDLTSTELGNILGDVRTNLSSRNIDLPLATSDLGENWTVDLAKEVDVVMANIHPFFAGVTAQQAASWTWTYWQNSDVVVTKNLQGKKQVISETGWPSGGGNDCGTGVKCTSDTAGSVAGVDEMNTFMDGWVCDALTNGTQYFWFETFDEPWKVIYNTGDENWEDKWGLMDSNRNLKSGVTIPDCGGMEANSTAS
ncbi:glycoside hydrolase family 17 protein [Saccharata proteae CBS 121410]|uniref:glucan endo-1,3-beta-D-glucosidase n=1 Tax=Saccharata proteae CBS 121410 TaxID=1314787 RepID=A0A9P4HRH7_9PEZI|nr:glycoside hydrolase family 17 protein [Saccharata proteae CBS 121410]